MNNLLNRIVKGNLLQSFLMQIINILSHGKKNFDNNADGEVRFYLVFDCIKSFK